MQNSIKIVGLDPSMSNFGVAIGELDVHSLKVTVTRLELAQTKAADKKQVRVNSDDLRRAHEIWSLIKPLIDEAALVFCELPVGSQSSRAQTSYGLCLGILACIDKPLIQVTPTEIKKFVAGKLTTSKDEIIEWAMEKHPEAPWIKRTVKGESTIVAKNEHLADAVAAIHTGMTTDQFRQLTNVLRMLR